MKLSITGGRSELGRVLARMPARGLHALVHVNVSGQQANTLLHDGHASRVPGWRPRLAEYGAGLDQVTDAWRDEGTTDLALG